MNKLERQRRILEIISEKRFTTIRELMEEVHVSKDTIMRDLNELTDYASFYTTPGRYGGIHAVEGWYFSKNYLNNAEEALLRELLPELTPDKQYIMQRILDAFARPHCQRVSN